MNDNCEKISVIMAVHNNAAFLSESIESILNQTYENFELIICDDASIDNSFEIAKKYELIDDRVRVIKNSKNLGAAATRNACISIASGNYIAIQDSDDISDLNRLEILYKALKENGKYYFVSCSESLFDKDVNLPYRIIKHKHFPKKKNFLRGMCFCHAATLFRKECIDIIGGYPVFEWLKRDEDYLMFMKLYGFGYFGFNIDDCLYFYRVNHEALKRRSFKVRLKECKVRFVGFKYMKRLFIGLVFTLIPILAFLMQPFRKK